MQSPKGYNETFNAWLEEFLSDLKGPLRISGLVITSVQAGRLRMAFNECCKVCGVNPDGANAPFIGDNFTGIRTDPMWGEPNTTKLDDETRA